MFKEFSAGYYIGQLYVEPYDGNHVVMDCDQHVEANKQVYATDKGLERLDHPLVMKVDQQHVPVFADDDVPTDTLNLPDKVLEATQVDQPPTLKSVFIAKAERAAQLLEWTTPYSIGL
ncbi:DUF5802 family protein [Natrinema soli]|uniref:DUF5802 family protein n=1 Tax=Natrinema soli TaxID=1930624 RepID=A0ABD5SH14_9EURY|nr:DUF5802 family protein [Natrinema soli]